MNIVSRQYIPKPTFLEENKELIRTSQEDWKIKPNEYQYYNPEPAKADT
ncbi:MAG: hypothetical protein VB025_13830 [Sphaerochaeta sp.]|jgi:hypothetical protein|nr:hypothetical protein [Sphaerochaeta sp.]